MKITFKEVGQGDSIILEWTDNLDKKIAIIDCNKKNDGTNPVLIHLTSSNVSQIEFILITHPHYDHFSGVNDILNYCENNKIKINYLLHTSFTNKDYLTAGVIGNVAKSELAKLLKNIDRLNKISIIDDCAYVTNNCRNFNLENNWVLTFLAPTQSEFSQYNNQAYKYLNNPKQPKLAIANANLLSTLIKIHNSNSHVLLTSDVVKTTFKKIHRDGLKNLKTELLLGQLPHHGAEQNYYRSFWRQLPHKSKTPMIISVGVNNYNHPSLNVIRSLEIDTYDVFLTNDLRNSKSQSNTEILLDIISTPQMKSSTAISKDWVFDLNTQTLT